jgi:adenylate cyclase
LVPLLILGIYIFACFFLFSSSSIQIPLVGPSLAFFLLHVGSVSKQVLEERAARDHLRRTFSTYVSSGILDAIYKNPDALQLGGGYKDVTILFSDIRSFTTMTESMDSVALVQQLNEYFTEMVGCINKYNGTLHKFIGDAIMAVWGDVAYAGSTVDAGQALRAAIDMREALKVLNARWRSEGRPEFHMGIGINHGKVVVGNIGAPQRMEFTVIGDSVNLASRLEGLTKKFGTEIMVGESVYDLTHERFAFRSLAKVQVVGKTQPTKIFEPLYELGQEALSPYSPEWVRLFEEAYARFTERRYDVAIRLFEACLNEHPENTTTLMLLEMSRNFAQQPPPEDWNGAFEFTSK